MKNIVTIVLLFLAGVLGYNYLTAHVEEAVLGSKTETPTFELANTWYDVDLPGELKDYPSIETCDTAEARVCFGSGATFLKETEDVTVASLVSTAEISRYGVQVKETGALYVFSIENEVPRKEFDYGNTTCYVYRGSEEGVVDNRELKIDIYGTKVTGTKLGYSQSVEYSVGYEGIIDGELNNLGGDTISAITTLTIADGGGNRQEEIYVLGEGSITEMRYLLVDDFENDILRINKDIMDAVEGQTFPIEYIYEEIDCDSLENVEITKNPSEYICFTNDDGISKDLMFGLDENEYAFLAQYSGQKSNIELDFVSKEFITPGYPAYSLTYNEIMGGKINGTYTQTHSGLYDYIKYVGKNGSISNFTNILGKSYVKNSCL